MGTADHILPEAQLVDRDRPISLFSVVVPIQNEARNLNELLARIYRATEGLAERREVIVVNDGSTDDSVARLVRLRNDYPDLKLVSLSRNFGKEVAMTAGLDFAEGDVVAILDADLQHPPEVLREFVGKWREGFDMVYGVPSSREHEGRLLRSIKKSFYHIFNLMSQHYMPIDAGDFRLIDRRLVDELKRFPERTRFMKGLFA